MIMTAWLSFGCTVTLTLVLALKREVRSILYFDYDIHELYRENVSTGFDENENGSFGKGWHTTTDRIFICVHNLNLSQ